MLTLTTHILCDGGICVIWWILNGRLRGGRKQIRPVKHNVGSFPAIGAAYLVVSRSGSRSTQTFEAPAMHVLHALLFLQAGPHRLPA